MSQSELILEVEMLRRELNNKDHKIKKLAQDR